MKKRNNMVSFQVILLSTEFSNKTLRLCSCTFCILLCLFWNIYIFKFICILLKIWIIMLNYKKWILYSRWDYFICSIVEYLTKLVLVFFFFLKSNASLYGNILDTSYSVLSNNSRYFFILMVWLNLSIINKFNKYCNHHKYFFLWYEVFLILFYNIRKNYSIKCIKFVMLSINVW